MAAFRIVTTVLTSLLLTWPSITAFNLDIDPSTVTVFTSPDAPQGKQYFGYSVALHNSSSGSRVLIGAPLANVTFANLQNYGTVYKCSYNPVNCKNLDVDVDAASSTEIKKEQWLGAVVHSQGKKAVTCAPRYSVKKSGSIYPLGRCFLMEDSLNSVRDTLEPCKPDHGTRYCQAGMSAQYDDGAANVVMGTVGVSDGKGGLANYIKGFKKTLISTRDQLDQDHSYMGYAVASGHFTQTKEVEFVGGAPRADNTKGKVLLYIDDFESSLVASSIPQPRLGIGSYFGSAVCAVDLNSDGYSDLLVGAPLYTDSIDEGRVFVYINQPQNGKGVLTLSGTALKGDNVPSARFGSAIACIGDINKDGYQDVAIGAPYEKDRAGSGAVYIYHGTSGGIESEYRQKILGSSVENGLKMFGQSISGDVDMDNNHYPDIAVGAYGSEKVVLLRSRRILDVTSKLTLSNSRIVLESNTSSCKDPSGVLRKCLKVTMAFMYSDPTRPEFKDLRIEYNLELDQQSASESLRRMYFLESGKRRFSIQGSHTFNQQNKFDTLPELTVYIREQEQIADVISELTFDLTFSLNKTSGCDNGLCPVQNSYKPRASRAVALFQKKCQSDKCKLDLSVSGKIEYQGGEKELKLGLVNEITVQLTVENKEVDTAYDAKVLLAYPSFLDYIGVKSDERILCDKSAVGSNGTSILTCTLVSPANPLDGGFERKFGVKFSTLKVKNDFDIKVETSSGVVDDTDATNNKAEFSVYVKFETDLEIKGSSNPDQVVYSEEDVKETIATQEDIGPKIVQTLQIRNNGPSRVDSSEVEINIPISYGGAAGPDNYLLYLLKVKLTGTGGTCYNVTTNPGKIPEKKDNSTAPARRKRRETKSKALDCRSARCETFNCNLGLLEVRSTVEIEITARLWQSTLVKNKVGVVDLETEARVKVPGKFSQPNKKNDQVTITTRANPAVTDTAGTSLRWYEILGAVMGGIVLLVVAVVLLYKYGFFKRKRIGKEISNPQNDEEED